MAILKAKARRKLPKTAFAYPAQRKYPIHDRAHARNALARAAQSRTFGTYGHVAAAVKKRFPDMVGGATGTRKRTRTTRTTRTTRSTRRRTTRRRR